MAYLEDTDLKFLAQLKTSDLNELVYCLTHDKDHKTRWTEELTNNAKYKTYYPNHTKYWQEIAAEIQCFGANSLATIVRGGKGVRYREVLIDVCKNLKVTIKQDIPVQEIERELLMQVLKEAMEKMTAEELNDLANDFGIKNILNVTPKALLAAFQIIFKSGGFNSYKLTVIIANGVLKKLIGRGLTLGGNAALNKGMAALVGPIGWAITAFWTAIDIASPAYRVTIPAVFHVAVLRQKLQIEHTKLKEIKPA